MSIVYLLNPFFSVKNNHLSSSSSVSPEVLFKRYSAVLDDYSDSLVLVSAADPFDRFLDSELSVLKRADYVGPRLERAFSSNGLFSSVSLDSFLKSYYFGDSSVSSSELVSRLSEESLLVVGDSLSGVLSSLPFHFLPVKEFVINPKYFGCSFSFDGLKSFYDSLLSHARSNEPYFSVVDDKVSLVYDPFYSPRRFSVPLVVRSD